MIVDYYKIFFFYYIIMSIIQELISLMIQVNIELPKLNGKKKKEWVLNKMRDIITFDNNIEEIIIDIIDALISVEKGQIKFNPKVKGCCLDIKKYFK